MSTNNKSDVSNKILQQEWEEYYTSQEYQDELEVLFEMDCIEDNQQSLPNN